MNSGTTKMKLFIGALFLIASRAEAQDSFRRYREGEWDNKLAATYFTSDTNYNQSGQTTKLLNGGKFQLTTVDLASRYTLTRDWAASLGVTGADAESDSSLYGGHSASGLAGGWVGTEYRFALGSIDLIPELAFLFPFQQVSSLQNGAIFNEGVNGTLANFFVQGDFGGVRAFASAGYLARGGGRSNLAPWSVGMEFPLTRSVVGAKVSGFESISDDVDKGNGTNEATRSFTTDRVNGGSLRFYSVNPALTDTDAYLLFELAHGFRVGFSGGTTLSGANQAQGYHGEVTVAFRFTPRATPSASAPVRSSAPRTSLDPSRERFNEDTEDGVDQKLFAPPPAPRPAPPLVVPGRRPRIIVPPSGAPRPVERRRVVIPPSVGEPPAEPQVPADNLRETGGFDVAPEVPTEPQSQFPDEQQRREEQEQQRVQKQLDDAEMQIELKVNKKRRNR